MENNARSGIRRVQAEMSFIFIFPRSKYRLRKPIEQKTASNELLWPVE